MTKHKLTLAIVCVTLGVIFVCSIVPDWMSTYGCILSICLILLLGIPHGATDHILFKHNKNDDGKGWIFRFLAQYLLLITAFGLVWMLFPTVALMFFLGISAYHFGQSHWHSLKIKKSEKVVLYMLWGGFILAAPILWNFVETKPILKDLTQNNIYLTVELQTYLPLVILSLTVGFVLFLFAKKQISFQRLCRDLSVLSLLTLLFYTTPLLVGFMVYFVFWHSIDSMSEQINQLKKVQRNYSLQQYIKQVLPFTLVAFIGIAGFTYFVSDPIFSTSWISNLFMLISLVTLPHSLLMDDFLDKKKPQKSITNNYSKDRKIIQPPENQRNLIKDFQYNVTKVSLNFVKGIFKG